MKKSFGQKLIIRVGAALLALLGTGMVAYQDIFHFSTNAAILTGILAALDLILLVLLYVVTRHDLAARGTAETALRESEERFRWLSNATLEGVVVHEKGRIIDANHTLAAMFGYEEAELIGMTALELAAPESRELITKSITTGSDKPYEVTGLRKDGSTFPIEVRSRAMSYQGRMVRVGALRDITERKEGEEAIRESEQRLFQILEAIPIGVFVADAAGKGYFANQAATKMLGKGIVHNAGAKELAETYGAYLAGTNNMYPVERMPLVRALHGEHDTVDDMEIAHADGRILLEVRGAPVYDGDSRIEHAVAAFTDITLRKRAEEALRELANIVDSSTDAIMSCSLDGTIRAWNRGGERLYGYSQQEAVGQNISLIVPPDLIGKVMEMLERIGNGESFENMETERVKKDGTRFPVELTLSPTVAADGTVTGYAAIARDITERRKAQEALVESEQRYSSVIATLEEGIVLQATDGSILAINGSAERILGISVGQMLGLKSLYARLRAIHEDGAPFTHEEDPTGITLSTGRPCSHVIVGIHRPDDRMVWLSVNSQPLLRSSDTQPYAVVSSLTDITIRKRAEQALHELSIRDALTGLFNRREMIRILDEELSRSRRYGHALSLVLLDVDHFKEVNDTYGHQVGDEVLQWLAKHLEKSLRDTDRPARYGGEEFTAILPNTTASGAAQVAERLRRTIAARPFTTIRTDGEYIEIPITISAGVAEIVDGITGTGDSPARAVIAAADRALYEAKRQGRNQVVHSLSG